MSILSLLVLDVTACSAGSDSGNGSTNGPLDGLPRTVPAAEDAGSDAGTTCQGRPFQQALVVTLPSTYTVAGFTISSWYPAQSEFDFATQQDPRRVFHHAHDEFVNGNLRVDWEDQIYHPEERIVAVARTQRISAITRPGQPREYRVRSGSDGNLTDETYNLPTLGPHSVMTTAARWNTPSTGRTDYYFVRNGAEIYQKQQTSNIWSLAANLAGSGSSNWEGLAASSEESTGGLVLFLKGNLDGGTWGIFEQRWPNALPTSAGPATLVIANTNAVPFGVSDDTCELYASRKNGTNLEVVVFRR
ncbi:hypothetical protein [Pendulispora albinea]|uniref:Uncharacterized protein n=1 Tax=Pendulispora albinea TaxID=2741071 RepID=A0ABZ2MA52_9BACT